MPSFPFFFFFFLSLSKILWLETGTGVPCISRPGNGVMLASHHAAFCFPPTAPRTAPSSPNSGSGDRLTQDSITPPEMMVEKEVQEG